MTDLALYFAWLFGLSDWRTGQALGMTEFQVLQRRRALGLKKTGRGMPARSQQPDQEIGAGRHCHGTGTMGCGAALPGATPRVQCVWWRTPCYPRNATGAMRSCDRLPATSITRG